MALIDVVSVQMNNGILVKKFPSDDLRLGTQLVVYPGQTAFFVKGGKIFDQFESGTVTLTTNNIPLLNKLINLPFGSESPFKAEVWFVNMTAIMATKWGTATPLQLEDPKYEIIVPVRSYGQYAFRIEEPRQFLETLVGNQASLSTATIQQYFKGRVMSLLTNIISDKLVRDNISILKINSHISDISEYCCEKINERFAQYGLHLTEFDIMSITPKEDDPSFIKLKEAKDLAARLKITGRDVYQMERSFDVMDSAASNAGAAGAMMGAGLGLGAGMSAGAQMGHMAQHLNTNPAPVAPPPPLPGNNYQYFVAINGQQNGPMDFNAMVSLLQNNQINGDNLIWRAGMAGWEKIASQPEFASALNCPPPLPPTL
ncbi:SPFH domain-containing protein [Sodaliphilus sp.]|uniref:SPFH domain-containing protein n=1 Tax=Sodaliphilus sp. TaxID=2815818 RepID=UPI00388D1F84